MCPYEEIGCKFLHRKSKFCKDKESCQENLCQFQHKKNISDNDILVSSFSDDAKKNSDYEYLELNMNDDIKDSTHIDPLESTQNLDEFADNNASHSFDVNYINDDTLDRLVAGDELFGLDDTDKNIPTNNDHNDLVMEELDNFGILNSIIAHF